MRLMYLWRVPLMVFLGATFFTSGMAKLYAGHHFPGWIDPVWLIEKLQAYQLGMYAAFIALSQVITGFLLLTRRFWLLGAIGLMPMLAYSVDHHLAAVGRYFVLGRSASADEFNFTGIGISEATRVG